MKALRHGIVTFVAKLLRVDIGIYDWTVEPATISGYDPSKR